mgnify:CR=1 FL=1
MKGAFMKKRIYALALTLAFAAGGPALASDLKMADGHILPLGNEMTIREADKSYVGKELQKEWNREKAEKEIFPAVRRLGFFGKGDTLHEKMMAEQLGQLFEAGRFSQLQMETKDAFHQAAVVSVKLEEKDIAAWNEIIRAMEKVHPKKIDILGENRTLSLETVRKSMRNEDGHERFIYKKDGQTEFIYGSMFLFVEQYGVEAPFYVFLIASADKGQFGATAIYTNQATGRIIEPVLVKGAEGLR